MEGITAKQKMFADEYLISLNPIESYKKVYKCKESTAKVNAYRLLDNASVSAYVKDKQSEIAKNTTLTQEWVLKKLEECVAKSMQDIEVEKWDYVEKKMLGTGEYIYDSKGATKALELLGKHIGMFKNDNKMDINIGVKIIDDI